MNKTILTLMLGNLFGVCLATDVNATPIRLMNADVMKSVQISDPTMADGMYSDYASLVGKKKRYDTDSKEKTMDDIESESETEAPELPESETEAPELPHHHDHGEEHGGRGHNAEHDEQHND